MTIKFAPLHLPLERRLQTVAIIFYVALSAFAGLLVILSSIYILLYTTYLRIVWLAYLAWIFLIDGDISNKGARHNGWVKNWTWWKYMADYFPVHLVKLPWGELDPKRNYLFCCFPHGLIATGAFTTILTEARDVSKIFPNHKPHLHTLNWNLLFPVLRELFLALGAVSSSAESLNYILSKPEGGNFSALVVGGAQEAFYSKPEHYKLMLKKRKGFVKIALKNGSPLVPVISFGEPDIFSQLEFAEESIFSKIQMTVKKYLHFFPLVPVGRGILQYDYGILPRRKEINVVVGEPIDVVKVAQPTQEQIDDLHKKFIEKLTELFETQKEKYLKNSETIHLEIV